MQGTRREDGAWDLKVGEYSKMPIAHDGESYTCWLVNVPTGHRIMIGPEPVSGGWEVDEHEDGTISVVPKPGNSNSILVHPSGGRDGWHGYIRRGVWESC